MIYWFLSCQSKKQIHCESKIAMDSQPNAKQEQRKSSDLLYTGSKSEIEAVPNQDLSMQHI